MLPILRKPLLVFGSTLLLSLLFCVLLWQVPRNAGIGAIIIIVYYMPITVVAGVVTTIVILGFVYSSPPG